MAHEPAAPARPCWRGGLVCPLQGLFWVFLFEAIGDRRVEVVERDVHFATRLEVDFLRVGVDLVIAFKLHAQVLEIILARLQIGTDESRRLVPTVDGMPFQEQLGIGRQADDDQPASPDSPC